MNKEDKNRNFILLNIGHAFHNADWNWKNIYSPFVRIHFVERGTAQIIRDDGVYSLKENHLYLTPAYTKHSYACEGALSLYYIHIYEDFGKAISLFDSLEFPVEVEADPLDFQLIKRLMKINPEKELEYYDPRSYDNSPTLIRSIARHAHTPFAYELETQGILKQIISRFVLQASSKNEHIEERILRTLHYIHKNIDKPIEVDSLADMCFLTKDHFIRLFKKEVNCTPGKYINRKKMERAQLMILVKDTPIKDIAYSLGIDNISYFNRLFKKVTGETPGQYKKKMT